MEIWSLWQNKTGFHPSCGCIGTTVWMHVMNSNGKHEEKARRELHKNVTRLFRTNIRSNVLQNRSCTATEPSSQKPSKKSK